MLRCHIRDLRRLMDDLYQLTGVELGRATCGKVQQKLNEEYRKLFDGDDIPVNAEYLYRNLSTEVKKVKNNTQVLRLSEKHIQAIVRALGYDDYAHFEERKHPAITPVLSKCAGPWFSYVRCNSGEDFILRAPVLIYQERKAMQMKLRGPNRTFRGELTAVDNYLYCLLKSDHVKQIHMVFKTALINEPEVLLGVFSGLSAGGDPIAGKEVLVKQQGDYDTLKPGRIAISKFESGSAEEKAVAQYFKTRTGCILKSDGSSSYKLDDLKKKRK